MAHVKWLKTAVPPQAHGTYPVDADRDTVCTPLFSSAPGGSVRSKGKAKEIKGASEERRRQFYICSEATRS